MDIEVYKLVVPLLGGFVGAVLGTHLALSRTKKEKIWDEKTRALQQSHCCPRRYLVLG